MIESAPAPRTEEVPETTKAKEVVTDSTINQSCSRCSIDDVNGVFARSAINGAGNHAGINRNGVVTSVEVNLASRYVANNVNGIITRVGINE